MYLIAGLGNPGQQYEGTRHNIGFEVVEWLATRWGWKFKSEPKFKGKIASGKRGEDAILLLKPTTYMNLSGEAVAQVVRYYQIDLSHLLIVVDDVDLPLGQIRLRINSGPGTHNGLKSVEEHLQTNRYARLRVGVGDRIEGDLASHVLGRFTEEEKKTLSEVMDKALHSIEIWREKGITRAMDFANAKPSNPSNGEKSQ